MSKYSDQDDFQMRRSGLSQADLLRFQLHLGQDAADWLANQLGYRLRAVSKLDDVGPLEVPELKDLLKVEVIQPEEKLVASRQQVAFWLPTRFLEGSTPEVASKPHGSNPAEMLWRNRPIPLPYKPLAEWLDVKTTLNPLLAPIRSTPRIDVDRMVDKMARGMALTQIPTETSHRLERMICVIEDRSFRLIPYREDHADLIDRLQAFVPKGLFSKIACRWPWEIGMPEDGMTQPRGSEPKQVLQHGCDLLVLGDLGVLLSDKEVVQYWREWIDQVKRLGHRVSAMVPFPLDRVPGELTELANIYSWQGGMSFIDSMPRDRDGYVGEILNLLAMASSFDARLLRGMRSLVPGAWDAALESLVWQSEELDSNQYSSAKNDRKDVKDRLRHLFEQTDKGIQKQALELQRASRAKYVDDPSLWFIELLQMPESVKELLPHWQEDYEDAKQALQYLKEHRTDSNVGRTIERFLRWCSERMPDDAVWSQDKEIGPWIRSWQREFHPTMKLAASTKSGEVPSTPVDPVRWIMIRPEDESFRFRREGESLPSRRASDEVIVCSHARALEIHGVIDPKRAVERTFWKSGKKPDWVSDFGSDQYGLWCEFQVPRHDDQGTVTQRMRWIKPGKFMMGSPEEQAGRYDDSPQHEVELTQGFWMADTQVTQELWLAIGKVRNPSRFEGKTNPVESVSWGDCQDWIRELAAHHRSLNVTLPTEAQWEYACRAGSQTAYCFGDDPRELPRYGWFDENAKVKTHPVKQLEANAWGLYDVHGNVWEWCSDWYGDYLKSATSDPTGPAKGTVRVVRGGCWLFPARVLRSACRGGFDPGFRNDFLGFRLLSSALGAEPNERAMLPEAEPGTERASSVQAIVKSTEPVGDSRERAFWKSGKKPDWVSDFGKDDYGLWYEFQLPNRWPDLFRKIKDDDWIESHEFVTQRMRWIKPGTFTMGSPVTEQGRRENESPQHEVTLTRGFWMADTPCTQGLWMGVGARENSSAFQGFSNPVERVSWEDCQAWLKELGVVHPLMQPSLPTEAQWEYACRSGSTGAYCFGDEEQELEKYAWYDKNSNRGTHPVGEKLPNNWGLYDVHGDVWEWCQDWYDTFTKASVTDPVGPAVGALRVFRGGCWYYPARFLRSACRSGFAPGFRDFNLGFRLLSSALVAEPSERAILPAAEPGTERAKFGSTDVEYGFLQSIDLDASGERKVNAHLAEIQTDAYTSIRVMSDQEGYQFDRLEKPDWAVEYGRDEYGLYSVFEVAPAKKGTPLRQRLRWIPPGRFMMGSAEGRDYDRGNEGPEHEVILTHGYWMFDKPCTQGLWTALMGDNPSYFVDPDRPVERVRWKDAVGFAKKLNEWIGMKSINSSSKALIGWSELSFRLPTEAEWEYACRAGTQTDTYDISDLELHGDAKALILDRIGWYSRNSWREYDLEKSYTIKQNWLNHRRYQNDVGGTRKVGKKKPNGWGLYDILGNVWEWCEDWYGDYSAERAVDPKGPNEGTSRVVRGCSWSFTAHYFRSACRFGFDPGNRDGDLGFRLLSPVDASSFPDLSRHSGVNLQIRRGTPPPPDRLAALLDAIAIGLRAQQDVLIAIHDYLKREGLIEATSSDSNKPDPERVAMLLLAPISDNPGIPTTARFLAVLTDWKKRGITFSENGQKELLRLIRDTVFLASFPEDDTREMIDAISNAIQKELSDKGSAATAKLTDKSIAEKLGLFAHALLMEQRSGKKGTQSFLYQLLNKKIEDDDTSIFFEDRFYEYAFIDEPKEYLKKQSTDKRIEEFAKGCMGQLRKGAESTSWKRTLEIYLETEHRRRRLIFVRISRPQNPKDIKNLEEIMNAFPRMVFIQMNAQGNAPVYVDIMAHIAQIDQLLTELFQKKS